MPSFVIAAHDEEAVIGDCLDALLAQGVRAEDVVVVANGCSDRTVEVAALREVVVLDLPDPGKSAALNAGDDRAHGFPRIYLDADIVVPAGGIDGVLAAVAGVSSVLAAAPGRWVDTAGRQWPVRAYFAVNTRLPAFDEGLFGRGMIALSAEGRGRFDAFPTMIADDLFLDAQFADAEKTIVSGVTIVVDAPFTTRDLLQRLVRVRRGNAQMRAAAAAGEVTATVRPSQRWAWLRVTAGHPRLWTSGVAYAAITLIADRRARRAADGASAWGRDASTRDRADTAPEGGTP